MFSAKGARIRASADRTAAAILRRVVRATITSSVNVRSLSSNTVERHRTATSTDDAVSTTLSLCKHSRFTST